MGLRIARGHRRVLQELLTAGPEGRPELLLFDAKWLGELVDNQLAEPFTDRSRILCERYRLTWQGDKIARFLIEEIQNDHRTDDHPR